MGGRAIGYGIMGTMQASWFLENASSRSAQNLLANIEAPYQVLSHMDSKVMSCAILLPCYFRASPQKMFVDLLKPSGLTVFPTRLKVHTHIVKGELEGFSCFSDRECMFHM